jgi:segregation and condensation protein B
MANRPNASRPARTGALQLHAPPLEPDQLSQPDDQGLSLDDLGQAYAALLNKGADPYPQAEEGSEGDTPTASSDDEPPAVLPESHDNACDITPRSILEAMLYVGHPTGESMTSERIAALMRGVRPAEIDELVRQLNDEYAAEGAPYTILSVGAGYQLSLRPEFGSLRDHFYGRLREARLSQAAVDILAIVAYHQPIAAEQIDRLRSKPSGHILSQLVRRDLLRIDRPADKKAKPTYATTERFLDLFGLENLQELPRSQEIDGNL